MNTKSAKDNNNQDDGFMYVRMMEGIAGPGFRAAPKQIIKASKAEARRLIQSGAAVPVTDDERKETMSAPVLGEYRNRVMESQRRVSAT